VLNIIWNLFAFLMFGVAGLWGLVLARHNSWPFLLLTLGLLAALSWGFYQRRFARWRTVVGWSYTGLSLGILGGVGGQDRAFWLLAAWVVGTGLLLLTLPGRFNGLFWTISLLYLRPEGWSVPALQSREQVLAASPFTLHEVVKVTEQLDSGVVQQIERVLARLEVRYRGDSVESGQVLADLEGWIMVRYRHHRRLRQLPVSRDLAQVREVIREEDSPIELFSSPGWAGSGDLNLHAVLESGPYEIWVRFLGSEDSFRVQYLAAAAESDVTGTPELQREFETDFDRGFPCTSLTMTDVEASGWIVESAKLRLKRTNRSVQSYPDLASAEADVYKRYRAERQTRSPGRRES
jgi:hypothetical protein